MVKSYPSRQTRREAERRLRGGEKTKAFNWGSLGKWISAGGTALVVALVLASLSAAGTKHGERLHAAYRSMDSCYISSYTIRICMGLSAQT